MEILLLLSVSSIGIGISTPLTSIEEKTTKCYSTGPVVLVTGFGPFSKYDVNPSQIIAETLNGEVIDGTTIIGICVPVNFSNFTKSIDIVIQAIGDNNPIFVIGIGLAAPFRSIRIEKVGLNLRRTYKDDGPQFCKIDPNGPWVRFSSLPTYHIAKEIRKAGIPARQSIYAGTSLCNALLYSVLGYINENDFQIKAGFIHVPLLSSQHPKGMDLETMVNATKIAIKVCLN